MNNSKLIDLYTKTSKHSQYQVLAKPIKELISEHILDIRSRYEKERLDYILKHLQCTDVSLVDIGGNTGYFMIELLDRGAKSAQIIEGNKAHSDFVNEAVNVLGWQNRVQICPYYMTFDEDSPPIDVDMTLLLNVLHHVGDDYGNKSQSINAAKSSILTSLICLSKQTQYLVFQLGFNWKGDRTLPLFKEGTKKELIDFIESGTQDSWTIEHIGVAEKLGNEIIYNEVNSNNIQRQDPLGEFLNRPMFIMQSKLYSGNIT